MTDELFYLLWLSPALALLVDRDAWRYVVVIMLVSLASDFATKDLDDASYFLVAATLDVVMVWMLPQLSKVFGLSCFFNLYQFLFGSVLALTGSPALFCVIVIAQFYYLIKIKGSDDVGGIGSTYKIRDSFQPSYLSREGTIQCKKISKVQ